MTDTLSDELRGYLLDALTCRDPGWERCHWVMSLEWFLDVRRVTDPTGRPLYEPSFSLTGPTLLLGLPVEIRKDGGAPHLEPT
jgi:HK97 family phage major capsid protein